MNENELLKKRINELCNRAYSKYYNTFTDFLNIDEISILNGLRLSGEYKLFGGYDLADRCVAGFGDGVEEKDFPICCIEIKPARQKFADKLTHRDFLGALMNLGINRSTLGDIVINENTGYLFCLDTIAEYIVDNLDKIKHTTVRCSIIEQVPDFMHKEPEATELIVSSLRIDAVVSSVYKLSRSQASKLFIQEKVFVNSKTVTKESHALKNGDIVSVRGYGKFIFSQPLRETKKGKAVVEILIYR